MKKQSLITNALFVWMIAGVCCALWGSAFPMIKVGYQLLGIDSADTGIIILFAGVRFILAGVLTLIIFSITSRSILLPTKDSLLKIANLSLFQTILQYIFFYLGLAFTTGQKASIINGSSCVFALIVSCLVFRSEHITAKKTVASILCFLGVAMSNMDLSSFELSKFSFGDFCIMLSAISYSFSSAFLKKYSADYSPYMLSGYQFVFGGIVMSVIGVAMGGRLHISNSRGMLVLLYLAFVSAVAYSLWGLLLKYNPVSRIAVCGAMTPIFGYVLSVVLLGEANGSGISNLIALLLVVCGIVFMNKSSKNKA